MIRRIISVVLLVAFTGWVAWYVLTHTESFHPILEVSWADWLALTTAFGAIMVANGLFVAAISSAFSIRLVWLEWLSLSFASSFMNYFLPFRGGAGIRALYLNYVHKLRFTQFISTIAVMYLMHAVVNSLLAVAGMAWIAHSGGPTSPFLMLFFATVTVAGGLAMLAKTEVSRPSRIFPLAQLAQLVNGWQAVKNNRALLARLWSLMLISTFFTVWQCHSAFNALGIDLSLDRILVYAASKNLASLIGLTPGAIGIVELVSIYMGKVLGYGTAEALSIQALIRAVAVLSLLLIGPFALAYLRSQLSDGTGSRANTADT